MNNTPKGIFKDLKFYLIFSLIAISALITYSNHFENDFHFDDAHTISGNAFIRDIKNIPLFFKDGTTFSTLPSNQSYRPVVSTTLAIDYWVGNNLSPFYFHLDNFIFFLLQGLLMFFFFLKIFDLTLTGKANFFLAMFGVAWYLLHPANAETINYIISRSDSLSTFFLLLGFILFLFSPLSRKWHLYLIPVAIGALAKPTAVMFAPLLMVYVFLFETEIKPMEIFKAKNFQALKKVIIISLPSFIVSGLVYIFIQKMEPETWVAGGNSVFNYLITQPYIILHYFLTFFAPVNLSADTDWRTLSSVADPRFIIGISFLMYLLYVAFICSSKKELKPIAFGILWFLISLVPSSSVIPLAEVMNDHRIYFPFVGLMISVCWTIYLVMNKYILVKIETSKFSVSMLAVLLLSVYAFGTHQRNEVWKTGESLWLDVTLKSPENGRGLMNYGLTQMSKGNYTVAEHYFLKALNYTPNYSYLHINLGILKNALGQKKEAENYFLNGVKYGPDNPNTHFHFADFLKKNKRLKEAEESLLSCIEISSGHLNGRHLLMQLYFDNREWEKLTSLANQTLHYFPQDKTTLLHLENSKTRKGKIELLVEQMQTKPTPEGYLELSLYYYEKADYEKCIESAKKALELKPEFAEAYNNIAAAYGAMAMWEQEIVACEQALKINPNLLIAKNNLNLAKSKLTNKNQ
ncbi:MAG: hypothetical protein H0V01_01870 [Bacteroidetes bacterium]|nr:hypothetical protein [Bacteroidota bacterium]HET6243290.1 hypothetical protein [Bacteroidia bacterium]